MTLPTLTPEQRKLARERSLEVRQQRAALKSYMAYRATVRGNRTALTEMWTEDAIRGMRVYDLLMVLPGIGANRARDLLQEAGIPWSKKVQGCGPKQTERLFALLQD